MEAQNNIPQYSAVVYAPSGASLIHIAQGDVHTIGRSREATTCIDDSAISRKHAKLFIVEGELWVEDLQSTNGTCVNGKKISRQKLIQGDVVQLGNVILCIHPSNPVSLALDGVLEHNRFSAILKDEVQRARSRNFPVALLMLKNTDENFANVRYWLPGLYKLIRPVDRVGLYSPDVIEILAVEVNRKSVDAIAKRLVENGTYEQIWCGVSVFPDCAHSADDLLGTAGDALQRCSTERKICFSDGETRRGTVSHAARRSAPIVASSAMKEIVNFIDKVARSNLPVLVTGETGAGKEVIANEIHYRSDRAPNPIVSVNCAAIPSSLVESTLFGHQRGAFTGAEQTTKGVFEEAHGGTIFLDEIGDLPLPVQATLLRVLETKRLTRVGSPTEIEVDVRLVAATNKDLEEACEQKLFRSDLLYRLNALTIKIPPLRDRTDDILPLAENFLRHANELNQCDVSDFSPEAIQCLTKYSWPGNVRELKNVIDRAVITTQSGVISVEVLPLAVQSNTALPKQRRIDQPTAQVVPVIPVQEQFEIIKQAIAEAEALQLGHGDKIALIERLLIEDALRKCHGNQKEAAEWLRMPRRTLVYKLKGMNLNEAEGSESENDEAQASKE